MHRLFFLVILILLFVAAFWTSQSFLTGTWNNLKNQTVSETKTQVVVQNQGCDDACQKEIQKQVGLAVASLSGKPQPTQINVTQTSVKPQDSYISISGSGSTTSTSWVGIPGTEFSVDFANDYKGAKFSWEGFLRVANANGTAYVRIFDTTHDIAVDGSELSVTNQADYTRVASGNLNFWNGRNVYQIQIKSLNSLNVDYSGGKIRVSY